MEETQATNIAKLRIMYMEKAKDSRSEFERSYFMDFAAQSTFDLLSGGWTADTAGKVHRTDCVRK